MSWASDQVDRYRELEPLLHAFAHRLHDLLEQLVEEAGIPVWNSYTWSRSPAVFHTALLRAMREGRRPRAPHEVDDVAGVAFLSGNRADADAIAALVERELDVDYERSLPPAAARAANETGLGGEQPALRYEHVRYVVGVGESRRVLTEWAPYADLRLEVHLPTISEHAWWSTEGSELPFHWPSSYAPASREALGRVAALYAEIDDVLAAHRAEQDEVDARYAELFAAGELEVPLDAAALAAYMRASEPLEELRATAEAEGMRSAGDYQEPSSHDLEQELLWLLRRSGLDTVSTVDEFLRDAAPRAAEIYRRLAELSSEQGFVPFATPESVVTFLVLVLDRADAETVELVEYREEIEAALNIAIGNPLPPAEETDEP